jgi:hypothetical protein
VDTASGRLTLSYGRVRAVSKSKCELSSALLLLLLLLLQVDEVKNIMSENIEKVLSRGEKLDLLVDKTDNLMFEVRCRTA